MREDMPRVTKLQPAGPRGLRIRFAGDRRDRELDLTGLMARSTHFAPLMSDGDAFAKAALVALGGAVDERPQTSDFPVQTSDLHCLRR